MPSVFVQIGFDIDEMISKMVAAPAALRAVAKDLEAVTRTAAETEEALDRVAEKAKETTSTLTLMGEASTNNAGSSSRKAGEYEPPGTGGALHEITAGLLQQAGRR